jgi:UDP-N-acetylmuramoyl-L-alanyl-D-glutamate--2,6-diaminopimelate ligase
MEAALGAKRIGDLAQAAGDLLVALEAPPELSVTGLSFDSGKVGTGDLFFCITGAVTDGHRFGAAAMSAGASALCVERRVGAGPEIVVADSRRAMGRIAAAFLDHPADDMTMIGVTGTNGKTTSAYLIASILGAAGRTPGLIGTIETRIRDVVRPGVRTTPESVDLQMLLSEFRAAGADSVAVEVTSHALALHRVEGIVFEAVAFTNLSQDHLDFHASMEDYFEAKRSLFTAARARRGAVNLDDAYGRRLLPAVEIPCLGFGTAPDAAVRAENISVRPHGSDFVLVTPEADTKVSTTLVGAFNVSNCLAAAAVSLQAGADLPSIERGIRALAAVPGRFESIDLGQPFGVVVDYAHTPDSLDNVLHAARDLASPRGGRVIIAFGCGGDRDRGKRPLMGAVAARLADVVIVTSDNPRSEEPNAIVGAILEGVIAERPDGADAVILDRTEAISNTLGRARPDDVVVIAGKGHETGQQFADRTVPFDDRDVARAALADLGWERRG